MQKRTLTLLSVSFSLVLATAIFANTVTASSKDAIVGKSFHEHITDIKQTNEVAAEVNGEKIYMWEVNLLKLQKQYENANTISDEEKLVKEIAKNKLALAEAKKLGLNPSQDEIDTIRKSNESTLAKSTADDQEFLSKSGLTKEELLEIVINNQISSVTQGKLIKYIFSNMDQIAGSNSALQSKINSFKNSQSASSASLEEISNRLLDIYSEYLNGLLEQVELKIY